MKKLFLGKSKGFLMGGIATLFILGSIAIICLKGTTPLFAQPSVPLSRLPYHFSGNGGGSTYELPDPQATCYGHVNSPGTDESSSSRNQPSSVPPRNNTQGGQTQTTAPSGNNAQGGQTQTGSSTDAVNQAAQATLNQINTARAQAGLPALQWSKLLVNSAHKHNLAMQAANQLSHQLSNESTLGTRISQEGVKWSFVAENIGESSDSLHPTNAATGLNQDMLNERPPNDGHRKNILSNANTIGIDVFTDTQHQKVWLTEDFARTA